MWKAQGNLITVLIKMEYKLQEIGARTRSPDKKAHKTSKIKTGEQSISLSCLCQLRIRRRPKANPHRPPSDSLTSLDLQPQKMCPMNLPQWWYLVSGLMLWKSRHLERLRKLNVSVIQDGISVPENCNWDHYSCYKAQQVNTKQDNVFFL